MRSSAGKRRRGGQPGNRNAAGNRGNRQARGRPGNRGGGAPVGNQNARKRSRAPVEILRLEYAHSAEALEWIERHTAEISTAGFTGDDQRDAAMYAAFIGMTPELLAEKGREYELGLYIEENES